jgi:hypothetical protein
MNKIIIGKCFVAYCQNTPEPYRSTDFQEILETHFGDVSVKDISIDGSTDQEQQSKSDEPPGPPMFWYIETASESYLLPRPESRERYNSLKWFDVPSPEAREPQNAMFVLPAIFGAGRRGSDQKPERSDFHITSRGMVCNLRLFTTGNQDVDGPCQEAIWQIQQHRAIPILDKKEELEKRYFEFCAALSGASSYAVLSEFQDWLNDKLGFQGFMVKSVWRHSTGTFYTENNSAAGNEAGNEFWLLFQTSQSEPFFLLFPALVRVNDSTIRWKEIGPDFNSKIKREQIPAINDVRKFSAAIVTCASGKACWSAFKKGEISEFIEKEKVFKKIGRLCICLMAGKVKRRRLHIKLEEIIHRKLNRPGIWGELTPVYLKYDEHQRMSFFVFWHSFNDVRSENIHWLAYCSHHSDWAFLIPHFEFDGRNGAKFKIRALSVEAFSSNWISGNQYSKITAFSPCEVEPGQMKHLEVPITIYKIKTKGTLNLTP